MKKELKERILKEMLWTKENIKKWNMWREIANENTHLDNEFDYERFSKIYDKLNQKVR